MQHASKTRTQKNGEFYTEFLTANAQNGSVTSAPVYFYQIQPISSPAHEYFRTTALGVEECSKEEYQTAKNFSHYNKGLYFAPQITTKKQTKKISFVDFFLSSLILSIILTILIFLRQIQNFIWLGHFCLIVGISINTASAQNSNYQPQPFRLWDKVACFLGKDPAHLTAKEYKKNVQIVCTLADSSQHSRKANQNAATARKFKNCDTLDFAQQSARTEHLTSTNDTAHTEHLTSTNDTAHTEHLTSTNDTAHTEHLTSTNEPEQITFLSLRDALEFYRKKGYSPKAARAKVFQNIQQKGLQDSETGEIVTDAKIIKNYSKRIKDRKPAQPTANAKKASKSYKRKPAKRKARSLSYHVRKTKERINLTFGFCLK